jgi:hypothetical protein
MMKGKLGLKRYQIFKYGSRRRERFLAVNKRWSLRTMEIVYELLVKKELDYVRTSSEYEWK